MRPRALVLVVLAGCQVASHDFEDGVDAGSEPAVLTISQGAHVFGDVATGQASATLDVFVTNTGGEVSGAISIALSGDGAAQFELVGGCDGETLAPADSCTAQDRCWPLPVRNRNSSAARMLKVSCSPAM